MTTPLNEARDAAAADGIVDLGYFGEPDDQAELDAAFREFPSGHGWDGGFYCRPYEQGYRAELRRGTPDGPDILCCGYHPTPAAAMRACTAMVRRMLEVWESGDTLLIAAIRASIRYAKEQKEQQQAGNAA